MRGRKKLQSPHTVNGMNQLPRISLFCLSLWFGLGGHRTTWPQPNSHVKGRHHNCSWGWILEGKFRKERGHVQRSEASDFSWLSILCSPHRLNVCVKQIAKLRWQAVSHEVQSLLWERQKQNLLATCPISGHGKKLFSSLCKGSHLEPELGKINAVKEGWVESLNCAGSSPPLSFWLLVNWKPVDPQKQSPHSWIVLVLCRSSYSTMQSSTA